MNFMLKAIHFYQGKANRVQPGTKASKGFIWVDCDTPSKADLIKISKEYDHSFGKIEDSLDEHERARVHSTGNAHTIIFKTPFIGEKSIRIGSIGIFWSGDTVLTVHKKGIKDIANIMDYQIRDYDSPVRFIHSLLEIFISSYFKSVENISDDLSKLEKKVAKVSTKTHTEDILNLRKSLIYTHKALLANREVLLALKEGRVFVLNKGETSEFSNTYNDLLQLIDLTGTYSEILSSLMEIDMASASNALGDIMKKLTVYASFALVPTLIASIYGMNFRPNSPWNMPELYWFLGYPFSLGLMLFSVIVMYYFFKKSDWI